MDRTPVNEITEKKLLAVLAKDAGGKDESSNRRENEKLIGMNGSHKGEYGALI